MIWAVYLLLGTGLVFQIIGALALHRFPDPYTRLHGSTMCTTFGSIFIYLGLIVYTISEGWLSYPVRIILIMAIVLMTNPTGSHAIARATYRSGLMPGSIRKDKVRGGGQND